MRIKLFRVLTGTTIVVSPPMDIGSLHRLPEHVAQYLNSWVDYQYRGFEIIEFISPKLVK